MTVTETLDSRKIQQTTGAHKGNEKYMEVTHTKGKEIQQIK